MQTKVNFARAAQNIVYVKAVAARDLPESVQADVGDLKELFAVHDAEGKQLALVGNRRLAFDLARENQLQPVAVH